MELLGDHTRNSYKDNYDIAQQFDLTQQISKEMEEKNKNSKLYNDLNIREFGITLYQQLITKYKLSKHDLTELQLDDLIGKYKICTSNPNVIDFASDLKSIIKKNIEKYENIGEIYNSFNQNNSSSDITITGDSEQLKEYIIHIDSNDRNLVKFPDSNNYQIIFGRKYNIMGGENIENTGMINRSFTNVEKIQIVDVTLLDNNSDTTNIPYLLLVIDELGNQLYGSNNISSKSIAKLSNYQKLDNYKYFKLDISKNFKPPIDINVLSIRLYKPNGELVNLDENSITIKIFIK